MAHKEYPIYKGLQRPLVFKMLKGRYIFWGIGAILAGVFLGMIVGAAISPMGGIITLSGIILPSFHFILQKQRKGLYDKTLDEGVFIIQPKQHLRHGKKSI